MKRLSQVLHGIQGRGSVILCCFILFIFLGCAADKKDNFNVLLITADALRADHLGCYGYFRDTSPFLDDLAAKGVLFRSASSPWPRTQPSFTSMLTSTYPSNERKVDVWLYGLPESLPYLPKIFKEEGYQTFGVISNYQVGKNFKFDQGFDRFVESWMEAYMRKTGKHEFANRPGLVKLYTDATIVTDQAIKLLEKRSSRKNFFMWLHYMDTHGPYFPPKAYKSKFSDWEPGTPVSPDAIPPYQRLSNPGGKGFAVDPEYYKVKYDREIRYWDDELKRFFAYLEKNEILGRTIIIITSDHGESMDEHDYFFDHGKQPYEPSFHVPLIMIAPQLASSAGSVVDQPVSLVDVVPTLLNLVDFSQNPELEGHSLMPLIASGTKQPVRPVFSMAGDTLPHQEIIRSGDWKLIRLGAKKDRLFLTGREYELYNLSEDPGEEKNLIDDFPEKAESLKMALRDLLPEAKVPEAKPGKEIEHSEFSKEMLKSLGYLD